MRVSGPLPDSFLRCMSAEDRKSFAAGQLTMDEAVAKAAASSERELQGWIVGWLRIKGHEVLWHRTDKRSAATVGWPDLTWAIGQLAIAWEVKLPGQEATEGQSLLHTRMRVNGWRVSVVHSMEEAQAVYQQLCLLELGTRIALPMV